MNKARTCAALDGLLLAAVLVRGCQGAKNLDNFRKVQIGWTQEQVKALLGGSNWYGSRDNALIITLLAAG
ncbi:hypothetical protein DFAR_3340007 [Desulfarculales bacterium]